MKGLIFPSRYLLQSLYLNYFIDLKIERTFFVSPFKKFKPRTTLSVFLFEQALNSPKYFALFFVPIILNTPLINTGSVLP